MNLSVDTALVKKLRATDSEHLNTSSNSITNEEEEILKIVFLQLLFIGGRGAVITGGIGNWDDMLIRLGPKERRKLMHLLLGLSHSFGLKPEFHHNTLPIQLLGWVPTTTLFEFHNYSRFYQRPGAS